MSNEENISEEYLLSHGFMKYNSIEEGGIYEIPFYNNPDTIHFREIGHDRQMFVVIFSYCFGEREGGYGKDVYVQHDAGCGFIEIPFPWWGLPVEYFESVYYGIRGYKPKST